MIDKFLYSIEKFCERKLISSVVGDVFLFVELLITHRRMRLHDGEHKRWYLENYIRVGGSSVKKRGKAGSNSVDGPIFHFSLYTRQGIPNFFKKKNRAFATKFRVLLICGAPFFSETSHFPTCQNISFSRYFFKKLGNNNFSKKRKKFK